MVYVNILHSKCINKYIVRGFIMILKTGIIVISFEIYNS